MISSISYNGDGSTRIFPVSFKINGEDYVRVYVNSVEVVDRTKYDIINNSIVFTSNNIPTIGTDNIKIYVATSSAELGDLGAPLTDITNVSNNLDAILAVSTTVVPNIDEILLADNNATIATTKALEASTSAGEALASKNLAVTSAGNALTSEQNAYTSEANALSYKNSAEASATIATTQAGIATTKAGEALASAGNALISRNEAEGFRDEALSSALSVDSANIVHKTGDETIAGIKTFSSSPIVPTPTTPTQVANKAYADTKQANLGFTPVQQGTGIGQLVNTVKIGWSGTRTKITIDGTDLGNIVMDSNIGSLVKTALNASGDAPIYACRAWVNFNGTGTVAIRASGNVSSITDNGVGYYTVNFTTAMPDANYSVGGITTNNDQNEINYPSIKALNSGYLTSSFTFSLNFHATNIIYVSKDHDRIMLSFFR